MLPAASRYSEPAPLAVIGADTVISPFCVPLPLLLVNTNTFVLPVNAALITPLPMTEELPLAVYVLPDVVIPLVVEPLLIVTSYGSSNHVPGLPRTADASTLPCAFSP